MPLTKEVLDRWDIGPGDVWISTGLVDGHDLIAALDRGYEHVYGIELDPEKLSRVQGILSESGRDESSTLIGGDSAEVLARLLSEIKGVSVTFWLDAHTEKSTPLLAELDAIATWRDNEPVTILVDDVRCWYTNWRIPHSDVERAVSDAGASVQRYISGQSQEGRVYPNDILLAR